MPGVVQHSLARWRRWPRRPLGAGIGGLMLFGVPTSAGRGRLRGGRPGRHPQRRACGRCADAVGDDLVVMADLCLDEFTDHGHCGVLDARGPGGQRRDPGAVRRDGPGAVRRRGARAGPVRDDGRPGRLRPVGARRRRAHRRGAAGLRRQVRLGLLRAVPRGRRVDPARATGRRTSRTRPTAGRGAARGARWTSPRARTSSW